MNTEPLSAVDIVEALNQHYKRYINTLTFAELRIGTGYNKDAYQRIDYWAMDAIPSLRFKRTAYEIKVSRSDFLAELRKPLKRRRALLLSNEFYFIAPKGLIRAEELPLEAGLMEVQRTTLDRFWLDIKHPAPWRDTSPPTWQFVAALVRRSLREEEVNAPTV